MCANIEQGMDSSYFVAAVRRFDALLAEFDGALAAGPWLAGETFSLADIAYAPYMLRLRHLGLDDMMLRRPRVAAWTERLFARPSYDSGIAAWVNPGYVEIFDRERDAARSRSRAILA